MDVHLGLWILFGVIVVTALAVDLGLNNHRHRTEAVSMKEGLLWTAVWILLAFVFAGVVYATEGHQRALEFVTAYLLEESLSVDNMFVFVLIFQFFRISGADQPKILKWGIFGAIIMRLVLIFTGVSLVSRFHWILYVFGVILIITAIKMVTEDEKSVHPDDNLLLKTIRRFTPVTPFAAALIVIEASDLLFALDSIPAVLAVSNDPFIIFTSNIFAILGLRALFFVVSGFLNLFRYLKYGLGVILAFIGVKMLVMDVFPIPISASLGVVGLCLSVSIACSILIKPRHA